MREKIRYNAPFFLVCGALGAGISLYAPWRSFSFESIDLPGQKIKKMLLYAPREDDGSNFCKAKIRIFKNLQSFIID